jgi:hypothetical protein
MRVRIFPIVTLIQTADARLYATKAEAAHACAGIKGAVTFHVGVTGSDIKQTIILIYTARHVC